ncbi:MAG: hypothetical protein ABR592_06185 [Nitriliruptorales bacterium]
MRVTEEPKVGVSQALEEKSVLVDRASSQRPALLAWTLVALSVALVALGWGLVVINGQNLLAHLVPAGMTVPFAIVGALITSRRPGNAIGWIMCAIGLGEAAALVTGEYASLALEGKPGSLPIGDEMAWVASWAWIPSVMLLSSFLLLLFPDGRLVSRRWRLVVWLALGLFAVMALSVAWTWPHRGPWLLEPTGAPPEARWAEVFGGLAFTAYLTLVVPASVLSLIVRLRRARGAERRQIKWFVYAGALTVLFLVVQQFVPGSPWTEVLAVPMVLLIPVGMGIAILRHHLYDIDLVINRSLVYALLTAGVIALYVTVVTVLAQFFQPNRWGVSLVAAGVVAIAFHPLRERLQQGVNRFMYGDRDDPYAALTRLGGRLEAAIAPREVLPQVTETVAQALRLPYVAIELPRGDGFAPAASFGQAVADAVRLPLVYQGETVGRLVVGPRTRGEGFSEADLRLLRDLARQTGEPSTRSV